jgi:UDP-galactopyranose mutase
MQYDYLIVGSGISGITIARVLAEAQKKVLIVDKRSHIGGNCYDYYDGHGILIHKYGPHILHTKHKEVWDFLSRFTKWRNYHHIVKAHVDGHLVSFPINIHTLKSMYGMTLAPGEMKQYLDSVSIKIDNPSNSKEAVISKVGEDLYDKFFKVYTLKQWGILPEKLSPIVCQRIPVRFSKDERYFDDKYQGIPLNGYTRLFETMLSHDNIDILLETEYADVSGDIKYKRLVYTGPVDEYFNYCHGNLGYRSLHFDFKNITTTSFQDYAVINYPNEYDFTRITEYKKLTGQKADSTTVSYEYPSSVGDPYYPVPTTENSLIYEKYSEEARKLRSVVFAGRLGTFRYLNMDIACLEGMKTSRGLLNEK